MENSSSHLLTLKVMRISRPSLLGQWQPFSASAPHFDAYNASSLTSIQHNPTLPGQIPSTIRDFSALSHLLTLPGAFGSIYLGETFSSCLCITNETEYEIEGVQLRVELQASASAAKSLLLELGGPQQRLPPSGTLEGFVSAEIKELGQHTLTCVVQYRVPQGLRPPAPSDDPSDPRAQLFRKHYRFPVSNPFSVKTKVHTPKSPTALMSRTEREKVFLEVHIQNLTQEPMRFERLHLEPVDGWTALDGNTIDREIPPGTVISAPTSLIQPQDTFQYVYILAPAVIPSFSSKPAPGSVIPLGRLDMAWRSTLGEPGHLLTSMLSRRVPQAPPAQVPSALPPHVQRAIGQIPRPQSPAANVTSPPPSSRPSSPVPYKSRQLNRPQTPVQAVQPIPVPHSAPLPTDVQIDLVVDDIPDKDTIRMNAPFTINFTATAAAFVPPSKKRVLTVVIQHVIPSRQAPRSRPTNVVKKPVHPAAHSPAPSGASTPRILSMDFHPSLVESPKIHHLLEKDSKHGASSTPTLPSPYADDGDGSGPGPGPGSFHKADNTNSSSKPEGAIHSGIVEFLGSSTFTLPAFQLIQQSELITPAPLGSPTPGSGTSAGFGEIKRIASHQFPLEFLPIKMGLATVGGIRVLLLSDTEEELDADATDTTGASSIERILEDVARKRDSAGAVWKRADHHHSRNARVLQEWPIVAEVWVGHG